MTSRLLSPLLAAILALIPATPASAQNSNPHLFITVPYSGSTEDALADAAAGQTIPLARYSFTASKDGANYRDTIVGRLPFAKTKQTTTIEVQIVPLIVNIGATSFDPTAVDSCIPVAGMSPLAALQDSPIFQPVAYDGLHKLAHAAKINGINVGRATYPDAVRRAEFWHDLHGTPYHTAFHVTTLAPWTIDANTVKSLGGGATVSAACSPLGVLNFNNFFDYISRTVIPAIPQIAPTAFTLFVMKNVVGSLDPALNCNRGCVGGYHTAQGRPVQTYAVTTYDTTNGFAPFGDIAISTHEVGEWLDDPLGANATPAWGHVGQVPGCQRNWEVGDPLSGTEFPEIRMRNGLTYHLQELAFWSWFYNSQQKPSLGAGGKFSSHGTFAGPAKACPPGGTF